MIIQNVCYMTQNNLFMHESCYKYLDRESFSSLNKISIQMYNWASDAVSWYKIVES